MRIRELFQLGRPVFSFEFFPPKDDAGVGLLFERIRELRKLRPDFVSVTYGAGGSTRDKTVELVTRIQKEGSPVDVHLSCLTRHGDVHLRGRVHPITVWTARSTQDAIQDRADQTRGSTGSGA